MPLSKKIQNRNQREQEVGYKIIIVTLVIALVAAFIVLNKIAVDRVQPAYDRIYNAQEN